MESSVRFSLRVYATIVLVASLAHATWYWFLPTYIELRGLNDVQWNTLFLFNWSITFLLLFLGILSLAVSLVDSVTPTQLRLFSAWSIAFWLCRLLLEFLFPLEVPLVIIPSPSLFIKFLIIFCILILAIPEAQARLAKRETIDAAYHSQQGVITISMS